jgi:hypothetical protein
MLPSRHRTDRKFLFPGATTRLTFTLGLVAALVLGLDMSPATAAPDRSPTSAVRASATAPAPTQIQRADNAFARAVALIGAGHNGRARKRLAGVQRHTRRANVQAFQLIGAPPTDPESDDPPGPPAVLAAVKLDYRIATGAVALFNGRRQAALVLALRDTVRVAQVRRDVVLDKVIALPPEGAGSDYSDGMSDTLGLFTREVNTIATATTTFTLSASGEVGLNKALARARATKVKVDRAWGGGERPAHAAGSRLG